MLRMFRRLSFLDINRHSLNSGDDVTPSYHHCERAERTRLSRNYKNWIAASGYALLAMTVIIALIPSVAHAQCASPVGAAGDMTYNDSEYVMQWCDGTNWNGVGESPYIPNAVHFDAGIDYLNNASSLTGVSDGTKFTISGWFRRTEADLGTNSTFYIQNADYFQMKVDSVTEQIRFRGKNSSGIFVFNVVATTAISDSKWHHILASFDLSDTGKRHVYIDGVASGLIISIYNTAETIDFTSNTIRVAQTGAFEGFDGEMADLWVDINTYIDLSVAANRAQFIDANGWPVDLGTDGSKATGAVPDIFLSGDTASWHTNKGTGGGFNEVGALIDAVSSPGENLGPAGGLIGWWKLDETAGTTAVDSGSLGNDGSYQNGLSPATHAEKGIINYGLNFQNNNTHYVSAPDNATYQALSSFTMAAWIKPYAFSNHMGILEIENLGRMWFNFNTNRFQFTAESWGGGAGTWRLSNAAQADEWTHVAVTYSYNDPVGTDPEIYINGTQLVHTGKIAPSGAYGAPGYAEVLIGNMTFSGLRNFEGVVDDARIYDRELSAGEIAELYNTGRACQNPDGFRGGDTTYNTTHHVPQYCNLREWKSMAPTAGDGGAGCTNPVGVAGDTMYNSTSSVMQYCEGDTWRAIGQY